MPIGQQIYRLHSKLGISQESFAKKAGISAGYVSAIEHGLNRPSTNIVQKIADAFSMPCAWFYSSQESISIGAGYSNEHTTTEECQSNKTGEKFCLCLGDDKEMIPITPDLVSFCLDEGIEVVDMFALAKIKHIILKEKIDWLELYRTIT